MYCVKGCVAGDFASLDELKRKIARDELTWPASFWASRASVTLTVFYQTEIRNRESDE